jgi:HD superfamily phosphohydrolase YqeK
MKAASILLPADFRTGFEPSGNTAEDVFAFLSLHGRVKTAHHCAAVAAAAGEIARSFDVPVDLAVQAGWLHDVSSVWRNEERLAVSEALGLEILPEERAAPFILHQKLSVVLAVEVFSVSDPGVLSAIGCHTTLKSGASVLDQVVFVADKLAWDQPGEAPYHSEMKVALTTSLKDACRVYLCYLWSQRSSLAVLHPWTLAAIKDLGIIEN